MRQPQFLFSDAQLSRKDNTLLIQKLNGEKKFVPVENVDEIYLFGENTFNTSLLAFLSQNQITLHVFKTWEKDEHFFEYYAGTFYPREFLNSGFLVVKQVETYSNNKKRLKLAKLLLVGASSNIRRNLKNYERKFPELAQTSQKISELRELFENCKSVPELMGIEGNIRSVYYDAWNTILGEENPFDKRTKQPPDNPVNALISFGNSLCYAQCLNQVYHTQLSPLVSFLHEPGERRFSLCLDLAEIFKPIIVDRLIFTLLNNRQIQNKHFEQKANACYLNEEGKKIFLKGWLERLDSTFQHRKLSRKVSYKRLILLECYKIIKHLTEVEEYEPLVMDW
ncbi:type I-B CRISPR-associated endonuclease Cas1 [bacterium]|nr:type I-B CRISPR-associated endonuclease Cas1 [bacterium]